MKKIKDLLNFSLINIDKPAGPTSFSVSEFVKKAFNLKKTSHMGTLDPKVTGVLPITLGRACKLANYFIRHDKSYVGILHTHNPQDLKKLQVLIDKNFVGRIKQTPPHRSAVKRAEREREVYKFEFLESSEDSRDFLFFCEVEGGTYIRKICSDLGEMIGGAHMAELRRTAAGIFSEEKLYSLYDLEKAIESLNSGDEKVLRAMLIPAEKAIEKVLPVAKVDKRVVKSLHTGKPLFKKDIVGTTPKVKSGESIALFCGEQFIGIYKKSEEKVIFGRPEFVYN
jgi:H/ACA ribonucleoprotein complex subunit 4